MVDLNWWSLKIQLKTEHCNWINYNFILIWFWPLGPLLFFFFFKFADSWKSIIDRVYTWCIIKKKKTIKPMKIIGWFDEYYFEAIKGNNAFTKADYRSYITYVGLCLQDKGNEFSVWYCHLKMVILESRIQLSIWVHVASQCHFTSLGSPSLFHL